MMKSIALAKMSATLLTAITAVALGGVVTVALSQTRPVAGVSSDVESQAVSTTQPSTNPSRIEAAWADLAGREPLASAALLEMASRPDEATKLLARELVPVQLTTAQLDPLLTALASNDATIWQPAAEQLQYFDPRLAIGLAELLENVQDAPARNRLIAILTDNPFVYETELQGKTVALRALNDEKPQDGYNFVIYGSPEAARKQRDGSSIWAEPNVEKLNTWDGVSKPKWTRAARAIVLLEHFGTPEARAIVDRLATGNPDAQPTKLAKEAIAKRKS